jgi:hypothetical protein
MWGLRFIRAGQVPPYKKRIINFMHDFCAQNI